MNNRIYSNERTREQRIRERITETAINKRLSEKIRKLAGETGTTEYMIFLSAAMMLLGKYSRQEDIVIGSPVSARTHKDTEGMLGMFVNTLAMRGEPKGEKRYSDFLQEIKEKCLKAYENQEYPFEELVNSIDTTRDMSRNPLFDVMLILHNNEMVSVELKGAETEEIPRTHGVSKFDLTFTILPVGEGYEIGLEYCSDLFCKETAKRLNGHYMAILEQIVEDRNKRIDEIEAITEEERKKILEDFNNTYVEYDRSKTVVDLFEEQVEKTPGNTAVVYEEERITYEELNRKANQLARKLREMGVGRNDFVALQTQRSIEMIIGIYGILKAGGAYVPIDPEYPKERIENMLEDCRPKAVVVYGCSIETHLPVVDLGNVEIYTGAETNLEKVNKPDDLIYCTYTSGTTGRPKGIPVRYRNMVNLVTWYKEHFDITEKDRIVLISLLTFDLTQRNIFSPHVAGAAIYCCGEGREFDDKKIIKYISRKKITMLSCAASMFYSLIYSSEKSQYIELRSLKKVVLGGEAIQYVKVKKFMSINQAVKITNVYGVTEDSGCVTSYRISKDNVSMIPIGKPLNNKRILICNSSKLCGIGIIGEICICGEGVTDGYLNNEELTAEKFVENPFGEGKMYRTGDLGRWLADGNIEFLGRIDEQVKIRGLRIELGEIESALRNIVNVKDCAVIAKEDKSGDKAIYAYIISDTKVDMSGLRDSLGRSLPEYMIPAYMGQIEKLPVTKNGKLDKRALPELEATTGKEYEAPRNETEKILCQIYEEILNAKRVGINDGFFELGGHSLRATLVINRIEEQTSVRLDMIEIFNTPTVKGLSEKIMRRAEQKYKAIPEAENKDCYPMSSSQKRTYLICQMNNVGLAYNMPRIMRLTGQVHPEGIRKAMQEMINRHEILRTEFGIKEDELQQWIRREVQADYVYVEDNETNEEELIKDFIRPFDLEKAPLFRGKLVKRKDDYLLMLDTHHIVSDGMSEAIYTKEINLLYSGRILKVPRQYKDYSEWVRTRDLNSQKEYWEGEFRGEIPVLNMPSDFARPREQRFQGAITETSINNRFSEKIRKLAGETGTTEYMIFLSAAMMLLGKYSRQEDIVIGSPVSARTHKDTEGMLGMFVNTLAMRGEPKGEKRYSDFLQEIKEKCLKAYENQEYPFEELVNSIDTTRDMSRNPLFDVMLILHNNEMVSVELKGAETEEIPRTHGVSKFDLTFTILPVGEGYEIGLEYCSDLFCKETAKRLNGHYMAILEQIVEDRNKRIDEIEAITEEERKKILEDFNNTYVEYDRSKTVVDLFEEQVEKTPGNTAVVYEEERITYEELNRKANQLARKLREMGVGRNDFVALQTQRSIEMIIGIYGILKAGGAYVPIDPEYPKERIENMLEDCRPKAVVVYGCSIETHLPVVDLGDNFVWERYSTNSIRVNEASDLIYCLYTSGTTGKPKGVMLKHSSIVNYSYYCREILQECDKLISVTSLTFDIAVTELIVTILNNITVILTNNSEQNSQENIKALIDKYGVQVLQTTPTKMKLYTLDKENSQYLSKLKIVMIGGEKVSSLLYKEISCYTDAKIYTTYGPTETTVWSSIYNVSESNSENMPIGQPIFNTQIYLLDGNSLCGIGVPGEIYIAGMGLAMGYLNNEELTAEKFVENPFGEGKMYRTGDLGRWLADGNIEFLGRIDEQVKIRGLRIELGEIESALRNIANVKDCAVIAKEDKSGDKAIYAYIISDTKVDMSGLRDTLGRSLPEYMIPAYMGQIEKLPITKNGKLDKRALPELEATTGKEYEAPRNKTEEILCQIYEEILNAEKVGINDEFFELGGDSIKAIRIISKLRQFDHDISLEDIYKQRTVKSLACVARRIDNSLCHQGEISGEIIDTPSISNFKEKNYNAPSHYNQAILFKTDIEELYFLEKMLQAVVEHHDVLRSIFKGNRLTIISMENSKRFNLEYLDFSFEGNDYTFIEKECARIQASIDLDNGPLIKTAFIRTQKGYLIFICIHHLVIDEVSWRILMEDLNLAYSQLKVKEEIKLPNKTLSYKEWSELLNEYRSSDILKNEIIYWESVLERNSSNLIQVKKENDGKKNEKLCVSLSMKETSNMLTQSHKKYNTEINDLLLSSLSLAIRNLTGQKELIIGLEGHGRGRVHKNLSIDRTIGWFTCIYPVIINCEETIEQTIIATKEMLRKVPNQGIGYSLLRNDIGEFSTDIIFNYIGEVDAEYKNDKILSYSIGECIADKNCNEQININGRVVQGKLLFEFSFNGCKYDYATIYALASFFIGGVKEVIDQCANGDTSYQTISDVIMDKNDLNDNDINILNNLF